MLQGRKILITGAARGLGYEIAKHCRDQGAKVIIADILEDEGKQAAHDLKATFIPLDLGCLTSIEALAKQIDSLDGLVNNAAIATNVGGKTFEEIDPALFQKVLNVNVLGTWAIIKALAPALYKGRDARIVNVASDTALWGAPKLLAYVASKGALIAMTRSLARELGDRSIGITCIAPGILKTESTQYVPEERHKLYETHRAVKGEQHPQDICGTIAFLLTKEALPLTGQCLPVDNGFVFT